MKHRFEKNLHVVNNLLSYCHELGCAEFMVDIKLRPDADIFELKCPIENLDDEKLSDMTQALNSGRQHEVEQNFWEMGSDFEPDSDLLFTGMMVDEAQVTYDDSILHITATRLEK